MLFWFQNDFREQKPEKRLRCWAIWSMNGPASEHPIIIQSSTTDALENPKGNWKLFIRLAFYRFNLYFSVETSQGEI